MRQRVRIILETLSAMVLIVVLLLAIIGVVAVKFYGEQLQEFVIDQVNQRLDSKVDIGDASVRVFHKFPQTSIVLTDITVWSSHNFQTRGFEGKGADTLLTARTVSMSFNPFSLIRKKYNIRQLEINQGVLHIYTDGFGEGNYKIISSEKNREHDDQQLNISQLKASDLEIVLDNRAKMLTSSGILRELELNGRLSRGGTQIRGNLTGFLGETTNKGILYASEREIFIRLNMGVKDSVYTIETGHLQIDRILADVDGRFQVTRESGVEADLYATARDLEIHEVLDLLPRKLSNPLQEIKGNGILQLYARVTGMISSTLTPRVEADFQTTDANLQWNKLPFSVKNLNLNGTYSNGGKFSPVTTTLSIESVSAEIGDDQISGRGNIHNFLDPDFSLELKGTLHPEQWIRWYPGLPVHRASGTLTSDISVTGAYKRELPRGNRLTSLDVSGNLSFDDLSVQLNKGGIPFSEVNGSLRIKNDFWESSFSGIFGESDFTVEGSGLNVLSFLINRNEVLLASATFRSHTFDLQEILDQLPGKKSERNASAYFPDKLNLKLEFTVDEFRKERFTARQLSGAATYDAPLLSVDSLRMNTMEGAVDGNFRIAPEENGTIRTSVNARLENVDIQQLFYTFHDFGQAQLTHEHLKGYVSGTSLVSATFDSTFHILPATILSENEVVITQGELNGFSPMMALSRFIDVEDLQHIQFEKLENTILLMDSKVIIPVMDIQSSALDLVTSGTHEFNNRYDYRVQLRLSELLYNKSNKNRNPEFVIAADASDTRTLFLKIHNDGSGPEVEVDREKTAQKIRNDLKQEKAEIRSLLNRELGLFRQGSEGNTETAAEPEGETGLRFEFNEGQDSTGVPLPKDTKRPWWKRRIKKDTAQNKPAVEFVIDE